MQRKIRFIAALLLIAAVATALFAALQYQRERSYVRNVYTRLIDSQDVIDTTRSALAALDDAEIHGQTYVLTGRTAWSGTYAENIRAWQDESGTLALITENDQARSLVKDFAKSGDQAAKELARIIALYDGGSRDKALDQFRTGAGIVYLDQARDIADKILAIDQKRVNRSGGMILNGIRRRYVAVNVVILFFLTAIGAILLIFQSRRAAAPTAG